MIKGVNKMIIEVNNPESEYFERAILFVKPGKGDVPAVKLANNAEEVIRKNGERSAEYKPPYSKVKYGGKKLFRDISALFGAAGVGAFIYAVISAYS